VSSIFQISSSLIKQLDDEQARELIARLCKAELRMQNLPLSSVTWGGDQRAADGGVDVRVDCRSALIDGDFVKHQFTAFQVKAEYFPPSKIPTEMMPKDIIRPAIHELTESGGAYVIVSTRDDTSDSALKERKEAIRSTLGSCGLEGKLEYDFYDSRRIADWVEKHPPILAWVKKITGQELTGWRPYGPWAYDEDSVDSQYILDDRVRVFVPNATEGSEITTAISDLRQKLKNNTSVRIIGLSGVGKTRLVQALFDERVCPDDFIPSAENVIYADLGEQVEPQPSKMVEALLESQSDSIIIIDNCGPATHNQLSKIVNRTGSRLKLITVEYDIRDDIPEGTSCYRLEGASDNVIQTLVKERYSVLSDGDATRIAEFSDGNARVAFAIAASAEQTGELSRLHNAELFDRLFHQKKGENDELLRCAEIGSLVYSFDSEDVSDSAEVSLLATLAETTPVQFLRQMTELQRRGLLQQRGKWKAILPHAIANGLAVRAIEPLPVSLLYKAMVESGNDRLTRSFTRRLSYLHECEKAVEIATELLSEKSRLGNITKLNEFESQMFGNIAPLAQEATLAALLRATENADFVSTKNRDRDRYARVARSLAYDAKLFNSAMEVLQQFALAEPEDYKNNSIREMMKSMFYCHLSGTQASIDIRFEYAKKLIDSSILEQRVLGMELLDAGLEAWHFNSHYGSEFGGRARDYGWYPKTKEDVHSWFLPWISKCVELGHTPDAIGRLARIKLAESYRALWTRTGLYDELATAAIDLNKSESWAEGWLAIRRIIHFDSKGMKPEISAMLNDLETVLAPTDLASQVRSKVLARDSFAWDIDDLADDEETSPAISTYERARLKSEELGTLVSATGDLLSTLVPELVERSSSSNIYNFGKGVGKAHPNVTQLLEEIAKSIENYEGDQLSLIFVRGIVSGWSDTSSDEVEQFLDDAMTHSVWKKFFVELQVQSELDDHAFARLMKLLDHEDCPVWQFQYLAGGRATDPLSIDQILGLSKKILAKEENGTFVAIDLLSMVIHCTDKKSSDYKRELAVALMEFLREVNWEQVNDDHGRLDHDLDVVLNFALKASPSENEVATILQSIIEAEKSENSYFVRDRSKVLEPFFEYFPAIALNLVFVPDEDGNYNTAYSLVSERYSDRRETAINKVPDEVLLQWCLESPEHRFNMAAATCKLFENGGNDNEPLSLTSLASAILAAAPDKEQVLTEFISRFQPNSWSGSLATILEKRIPLLRSLNPDNLEGFSFE